MIDRLLEQIRQKKNPSVIGLDTRIEYIPDTIFRLFVKNGQSGFQLATEAILYFNKSIIDAIFDIIPAIKVQTAYYEMYGVHGMQVFRDTCAYARNKGLIVIGDAKRNDIGATAQAYSTAYLGKTNLGLGMTEEAFPVDFLTINPYLGVDGIQPFLEDCKRYKKGLFILTKTSNPSSGQLQDLLVDGKRIYEIVGEYIKEWSYELQGQYGYSSVGAVVGATYPEQMARLRNDLQGIFFLVPGYGVQGASGDDIANAFDKNGWGAIVNASRSVLCAYQKQSTQSGDNQHSNFAFAARLEVIRMRDEIINSLQKAGINLV